MMEQDKSPKFYCRIMITNFEDPVSKCNNDLNVSMSCFKCDVNNTEVVVAEEMESTSGDRVNCISGNIPRAYQPLFCLAVQKLCTSALLGAVYHVTSDCLYYRNNISMDILLNAEIVTDVVPQVPTKPVASPAQTPSTVQPTDKYLPNRPP